MIENPQIRQRVITNKPVALAGRGDLPAGSKGTIVATGFDNLCMVAFDSVTDQHFVSLDALDTTAPDEPFYVWQRWFAESDEGCVANMVAISKNGIVYIFDRSRGLASIKGSQLPALISALQAANTQLQNDTHTHSALKGDGE